MSNDIEAIKNSLYKLMLGEKRVIKLAHPSKEIIIERVKGGIKYFTRLKSKDGHTTTFVQGSAAASLIFPEEVH